MVKYISAAFCAWDPVAPRFKIIAAAKTLSPLAQTEDEIIYHMGAENSVAFPVVQRAVQKSSQNKLFHPLND